MKTVIVFNKEAEDNAVIKRISADTELMNIYIHNNASGNFNDSGAFCVHPSCFPPLHELNSFLGNKKKSPVYFNFPLEETALVWIIKIYLAGFRNIVWLNQEKEIRHNLFIVLIFKSYAFFKNRVPAGNKNPYLIINYMQGAQCSLFKVIISLIRFFIGFFIRTANKYNMRFLNKYMMQLISLSSVFFRVKPYFNRFLDIPVKRIDGLTPEELRIVHFIGTLGAGGAEGQLAVSVIGMKKEGFSNIKVLTYCPLRGYMAHNLPRLNKAEIPAQELDFTVAYDQYPELKHIPLIIRHDVAAVYCQLKKDMPDVFHAWLDYTNIIGGIAALMAGVPLIILSTRSVSPCHFPYLFKPWFKPWYRLLAQSPRVRFINNSTNGGKDYAKWLKLPPEKFKTILNGVDFDSMKSPSAEKGIDFRKSLGIPEQAFLICGLFRLSPEKRSKIFFRVIRKVMEKYPHVYAVQAGEGEEFGLLKELVEKHGLEKRFFLLGRRSDIPVILSSCDSLLLTSDVEGTPNVLLEAQWFGCCPVSTNAGGISDCILNGETGFISGINDENSLVRNICRLIEDKELREKISKRAPGYIKERFDIKRMVAETLELYKQ